MSLQKVIKTLREKNNFVITTHVNMEGDALGSELAMYLLLKGLGKQAVVVNDDEVAEEYFFMPLRDNDLGRDARPSSPTGGRRGAMLYSPVALDPQGSCCTRCPSRPESRGRGRAPHLFQEPIR